VRFRPTGRIAALALVTAAVIVPLGVFGAPALARSASSASQYQYSGSSQYQYRVAICHFTHSKKHPWHVIVVSSHAVKAHLKHGDTLAPCPTTAAAPTKHHGKGNGKGKGDDDSQGNNSSNSQGSNDGPGNSNGHGKGHNK
jgi:hypothetical protein